MKNPLSFGKYLLLQRIAIGGMAEVFVAVVPEGEPAGRLFAVKRLLPSLAEDPEIVTMFLDEARITAQLNHPSIVPIYELGKQGESYYIAMEYVPGRSLHLLLDKLRRRGELMPIPIAAYITSRISDGLDYAHRRKNSSGIELRIVHRDVSPQNVLVSVHGDPKLIDFGIAQAAGRPGAGGPFVLRGKLGYLSPEQVRGRPVDRRSDVFSAGVVLYEMLTGRRLFAGGSELAVLEKVKNGDAPPPSRINPAVPRVLDAVVLHALARQVEDRTAWASEIRDALAPFVLGVGASSLAQLLQFHFPSQVQEELVRIERLTHAASLRRVGPVHTGKGNRSEWSRGQ